MSREGLEDQYLKLREVLNEPLLRDLILFILLYLFILTQSWQNLILLSFPMISFGFSLFFRILSTNKRRIYFSESQLIYNPIGSEKVYANRLVFISLVELILLFWIGAESIYHPQLIKEYDFYFSILFGFIYSFGFFWLFIDLWENSKIAVKLSTESSNMQQSIDIILSKLNMKKFRLISLSNFALFLLCNVVNIIFQFLLTTYGSLGIEVHLPGTGIENSEPLYISFMFFIILIAFPLVCVLSLLLVYKDVKTFNKVDLMEFLNSIPLETRQNIIDNLKNLTKKNQDLLEI
ncbi:MAG: hypothetical protein ACFE9R_15310 [Candidatus Hermodarchaeota archaeon]